ncbi:DUF3592 domain-containing protein [Mycobacterium sp. M1]|uniref:DUF3592 domain-containing protein n=1 Tax=Mycolicibacter acidiphilus TaxID=2835306 RepID=A0ABS5RGE3_9MYCO|nr:DUF3592 domain-containing protein [Mycolicibacter acidiphilus]MBS9532536.1 DUF3592 domain-containing protein [Mycolicibacter acidiphilus]
MQHPEDEAVTDPKRQLALRAARKRDVMDYVPWAFAILGVLFLVIGVGVAWRTVNFRAGAQTADAVVVERIESRDKEGSTVYAITVEYTVDGRSYRYAPGDRSNSEPEVGEHLSVFYRPDNPGDARLGGFAGWSNALIFTFLGSVFGLLGGTFIFFTRRDRRRQERTVRIGEPLTCVVESIVENTTYSPNGDSSTEWVLTARYDDPANNRVLRFKRNYSQKPRGIVVDRDLVTVFVDPDDPSNYVIAAD